MLAIGADKIFSLWQVDREHIVVSSPLALQDYDGGTGAL